MSLPSVTLTGNLVADPELRFTNAGKAIAKLRVACNSRVKGADGQWTDGESCFLDVTVWDKKGEAAAETLRKGSTVTLTGRLAQRSWEAEDGTRRHAYEIHCEEIAATVKAQGGGQQGGKDPWASAEPAMAGAGPAQDELPPF